MFIGVRVPVIRKVAKEFKTLPSSEVIEACRLLDSAGILSLTSFIAFVYGSVASGQDRADSDIDLMVVAEALDYPTLFEALQTAERQLGRPVNPNLMTPDRWRRKSAQPDSFAARLLEQPRLFVLGEEDDLR